MLALDHLAIWTAHRDRLAQRTSELTGLPILDGFMPEGRRIARGVRFAGGAFLDLHMVSTPEAAGEVFVGLRGSVDAVEAVAIAQGWGVRTARWQDADDGSPWSILSFRRGLGLLNKLFVIEYAEAPEAWASPVFDHPLYRLELAPATGPRLSRVWLRTKDVSASGRALEALGFVSAGKVRSAVAPGAASLYRGAFGELALFPGEDEAVVRFDVSGVEAAPLAEPFGERLTVTLGETP